MWEWKSGLTGNLITMLRLLKNTTFSTALHRVSDIIENLRTVFENSDTRLSDALCDVNTEGKLCQTEVLEMAQDKKSSSTPSIVIKLPISRNDNMYFFGFYPKVNRRKLLWGDYSFL